MTDLHSPDLPFPSDGSKGAQRDAFTDHLAELVPIHRSQPLTPARVQRAKAAYTTRRFDAAEMATLVTDGVAPRAGDLVLARVVRTRQHGRLELASGRRSSLSTGDEILVCYGNRYASDQFEAIVPEDLGPCHLVAAGGVAARERCRHAGVKPATEIEPLGLVADASGRILNLRDRRMPPAEAPTSRPLTLVVVGSAMNAGKTTTACNLVKGLRAAGLRVGAAKVTGTGAGGDRWKLKDAGAWPVLDFTDLGHVSTYRLDSREVLATAESLVAYLASAGSSAIVLEIADGLLQTETEALLSSAAMRDLTDAVFFAASDAMGAIYGVDWLQQRSLPVLGVTGVLTRSPLQMREAEERIDVPVFPTSALTDPELLGRYVEAAGRADADVEQAV